jgi:hypothetical protein
VRIDGPTQFNLLAVWACHAHANSYEANQGPLMRAMNTYGAFIQDGPTVVAGDFNDNVLWDSRTFATQLHRGNCRSPDHQCG